MSRQKSFAVLIMFVITVLASRGVVADVVYLGSGQKLTNVQVLSKNWKGYEVQLTQDVKIFFARNEISDIEYDRIEPGRAKRHAKSRSQQAGGAALTGKEVPPELGNQLQQLVNVQFENQDIRKIMRFMSEIYGINVEFGDAVFGPDGLEKPNWTVDVEEAPFIRVLEKLLRDKGLQVDLKGDVIRLMLADQTMPPGAPDMQPVTPPGVPPPADVAPPETPSSP